MDHVATRADAVKSMYEALGPSLSALRSSLKRPLTLAEKILFSHLDKSCKAEGKRRGKDFLMLRPDRVAMQDATAQMAVLQFIQSGRKKVAVPSTVHCDHLIRAHTGAGSDMQVANKENQEVYEFLRSASQKYGIGFWGPGSGIIHQVVLENYAFPGGLMIGTDSHTPNAGGLGMAAIGVGGADAVDVMAGMPWELLNPQIIGVKLTGSLKGWSSPKDVILKVLDLLTVKGGTNCIMEYFGPGLETISCTGKGTIANMGAELGATTSVFSYTKRMGAYLRATGRADIADLADKYAQHLRTDPEVEAHPEKYYDKVIHIDLDTLEPHIVGPHSPDLARPVSRFAQEIQEKGYADKVSAALIGSCTNSSYEDIVKAASVAKECLSHGIKAKTYFLVSPGSEKIYNTIKRDGLLDTLVAFGGVVLANACGPCIGQWQRDDIKKGEPNSIVTSFNRNFRGRNDANPETQCFISSPEMVIAYAASGSLSFNPLKDSLKTADGKSVKLAIPHSVELPQKGFEAGHSGYIAPATQAETVNVAVSKTSERLQLLDPFKPWDGKDFKDLRLLVKTKGKTTTDHISPAGTWLKFRGHLDRISDNMLLGATNAYYGEIGHGKNDLTQGYDKLAAIARSYKSQQLGWVIVGDENYGEGSSREHAAMSPRFLGGRVVLVRSFARIHETNLKKQGMLALTFKNPADYDLVQEGDRVSILGLDQFAPGKPFKVVLTHKDGKQDTFEAAHSYNAEQFEWFKAGSALNLMKD